MNTNCELLHREERNLGCEVCSPLKYATISWTHEPYSTTNSTFYTFSCSTLENNFERVTHVKLRNNIPFFQFSTSKCTLCNNFPCGFTTEKQRSSNWIELFIGQLPIYTSYEFIFWMLFQFNIEIKRAERVIKNRRPTGSMKIFCDKENADKIFRFNLGTKRILVEEMGFWFASTLEQKEFLEKYISHAQNTKEIRSKNIPFNQLVIEPSKSFKQQMQRQQMEQKQKKILSEAE